MSKPQRRISTARQSNVRCQVAILSTMLDGAPHHKDELKAAGVQAADMFDSLHTYHRRFPEFEAQLQQLRGEAKEAEILRQQIEGAKIIVGKAMSHLVDRGLMLVVGTDGKGRRETFRLSALGRRMIEESTMDEEPEEEIFGEEADWPRCELCHKPVDPADPETRYRMQVWVTPRSPETDSDGTFIHGVARSTQIGQVEGYGHGKCIRRIAYRRRDSKKRNTDTRDRKKRGVVSDEEIQRAVDAMGL